MIEGLGYELHDGTEVVFETPNDGHSHFFGYYDKTPLNRSGDKLLSHRVSFDGRPVTAEDVAEVGYWDLDEEEFVKVGETQAFNWQQGSMLQWLPPDREKNIIYNIRDGDSFKSLIVDIESGENRVLPRPIYAIHPSGTFALCANFERFYYCRPGYNYSGVRNPKWDTPIHDEDGIYRMDLGTGETKQIISTREICEVRPKRGIKNRDNWLEHMMWNTSGNRFAFLHRWRTPGGGHKTRLFTVNADGEDMFMYPDTGFYSHMGWKNEGVFTIWGAVPSFKTDAVNSIRRSSILEGLIKPFYRLIKIARPTVTEKVATATAFMNFRDKSNQFELLEPNLISDNGHNSWTYDERYMLTDTYSKDKIRYLNIYDAEANELIELGRFHSEYSDSVFRCDLHPRWGHQEELVSVDSAHQPKRQLLVLKPNIN